MIRRLLALAASLIPGALVCGLAGALVCVDVIMLRTGCAESSLVETAQLVCLVSVAAATAFAAARRADLRGGLVLVSGFFFTMAVRELDGALDRIAHGCWIYPAAAVVAASLALAYRHRGTVLPGLEAVRRGRAFELLAAGLFTVVGFSRIIGYKGIWKAIGDYGSHLHVAKRLAEESLELFGYAMLAWWAVCFAREALGRDGVD